ncbi:hypothetical protein KUTeg_012870 [Tegillarca granosa]|uniref:protein-tyrosine-phosphatase n=1 Tax=Tegillarca granosa TaxID=220873 RepID=A0ABQ9EUH0_TEGGR|nr:hypothetical protein KUTeg_012870 [Tegillarca granosa]
MPFGLKFKKTRRYEISSKNTFVVGVYMLDNSFLECTLSADSTGQECLDSIAQRIELPETQYFGLRYVTKKLQFHWVDLDKSLKKQIDKHAQAAHSPKLYFGVMFYIPGAHKITDEVARYQYFLQLKNDIVDGRIPLSMEQAVRLAAFSLQAEFGDHDYDRNAQDYFKENALFPKTMSKDENTLAELMNESINGYVSLQGVHPVKAEIQYIKEIQMMDGYGMEYFAAKDEKGKELYLGTSHQGMFARYLDGQATMWTEIARLQQSKKSLEIDTSKCSAQYQLEDTDTAKYVRRMGILQQKFYKSNKGTPRDIQQSAIPQRDSTDQLTQSQTSLTYSQHSQQSQQSHDQRYEHDLSQSHSTTSTEDYFRQSQQSLENSNHDLYQQQYIDGGQVVNGGIYSNIPQQHLQQTPEPQQMDPSYANRLALLPAYRPSPSYDEVMRRRANSIQQDNSQTISHTQIYTQPVDGITYSQPEIQHDVNQYTGQENQFMISAPVDDSTLYANVFQDEKNNYLQYSRQSERSGNLVIQPTYSSPDLPSQGLPQQYNSENILHEPLPYQYKAPPPYPSGSNSTPDLAVDIDKSNATGSPDLVSRKTLGLSALEMQSQLDKSVEDLSHVQDVGIVTEVTNSTTEIPTPEISIQQPDQDDGSSDNSNVTFHVKDTDSEVEDGSDKTPQRQGSKSAIQIKYVTPAKAPPPSASKEVITRRESFRRLMIARSGQKPQSAVLSEETGTASAQGDKLKHSDIIRTSSIKEVEKSPEKDLNENVKNEKNGTVRLKMGPLKIAAMNGLTMSRPMALALMNDESRAPKDERRRLLENKLSENLVFKEFEEIPKKVPSMECQVAKLPENESRNRFRDVLPYDATRVKLSSRKDNPSGYINASHVKLSVGERIWWYIATQAPLENTVTDFWQMIWEQEVDVIGMLTAFAEMGKMKCFTYWPQEIGPAHTMIFGDFQVTLMFCNDSLCYITNRISVVHLPSKKERQVWHLQYTDWPDHGCPDDMYGFLGFLDEVESVQRLAESEEGSGKKSPIVIHCSAGVGRTGVVILTQVMKWCLEHNHDIDLPRALGAIRQQRMFLVQTLGQYNFIHKTLIQYLKNTRLI